MNQEFQQCVAEATRLTRAGDLAGATALLQRALRGQDVAPAAPDHATAVIDVECREVRMPPAADTNGGADAPTPTPTPTVAELRPIEEAAEPAVSALLAGRCGAGRAARAYKHFVPPQASLGAPLPLIVMLHGCTQDADDFARGTQMNDLACEQGFHVLYPEQSREANPQGCWNWFKANHQQRGRGEVETLATMIREAVDTHGIDASRVYVAGLSAGGAMAAALAAAYPDLVAAFGVHSGLAAGVASDLPSALGAMKGQGGRAAPRLLTPAIVFHGDADSTVHASNGEAVFASVLPETGSVQRERIVSANGRAATRQRRITPEGRVLAEHWVLHGAGHAWSGGSARGSHTDPRGPSASAEMLRFFAAHRLDAPNC